MVEFRSVKLIDLFAAVSGWSLDGAADTRVSSLVYRADEAQPGSLFFCVPGFVHDGHDYAPLAVSRGAVAVCGERHLSLPVTQITVPHVREVMGPIAAVFYERPSLKLLTVGITGTNGKTTSAFLAASLLDHAGLRAGLMGTVERRIGGKVLPAERTTPEAVDIQRDLALMSAAGDKAAVMEVSSHALELDRVRGVDFRVVAFTNLSQDHLDFHQTLDRYFAAKSRLFLNPEFAGEALAVINVDDPFGRRLAEAYPPERTLTFSILSCTPGTAADLEMSEYHMTAEGTCGTLILRARAAERLTGSPREIRASIATSLPGIFNVSNVLTALGIGVALGLDLEGMLEAVRMFRGVPGRMEAVKAGQDFTVLVDYAHTPDSVRNVLRTAREITEGRLIAVLGCGGDRDKKKRPLMGREAECTADLVVVTSDNPRGEDPLAIIADILAGLERPEQAVVEPDRRLAIKIALREARAGDVVMILGKGHETSQEFADRVVPFDDRQVARELLEELRGGAP